MRRSGPAVMSDAGWSVSSGQQPDRSAAFDWARPTLDVLELAGCASLWRHKAEATEAARQFARAALRP